MGQLAIRNLSVSFPLGRGHLDVVKDVTLTVEPGGMTVLLGPSGCGKSTVLNAVAGLVNPTGPESQVLLDNQPLFDRRAKVNVPPNRRHVGMVFQSYALWPHLTVFDNVAFPLRRAHVPRAETRKRVATLLELVRCGELSGRYPGELSGGQQQRVALARALAAEPRVLLFDEPLSNLDAELRRDLRAELSRLHERLQFTGLYVTHDHAEAFGLATTVVVMRSGEIQQVGSPLDVYNDPANLETMQFFGANCVPVSSVQGLNPTILGEIHLDHVADYTVAVHPSDLDIAADPGGRLVIAHRHFAGSHWEYGLTDGSGRLIRAHRRVEAAQLEPGTLVSATPSAGKLCLFDASGARVVVHTHPVPASSAISGTPPSHLG